MLRCQYVSASNASPNECLRKTPARGFFVLVFLLLSIFSLVVYNVFAFSTRRFCAKLRPAVALTIRH